MGFKMRLGGKEKPKPKVFINLGALLDVPTSSFMTGAKGETFMNGGLSHITGIVGPGGMFKSTLMHHMALSAFDKVKEAGISSNISSFDTENNMDKSRLNHLASKFEHIEPYPTEGDEPEWDITDTTVVTGNVWVKNFKEAMAEKIEDKSATLKSECFVDPITKKPIELPTPSLVEIDSLTMLQGETTDEMLSGDLDKSDTNTYAIKQGSFKNKFMNNLPKETTGSGTYILMTAHTGEKLDMNVNPYAPQPPKKLQFLKGATTIKSTGTLFTFLTTSLYEVESIKSLLNGEEPQYPKNKEDTIGTDLSVITVKILRSKNGGGSGIRIPIVVSQQDGVLPTLTEFHFLKSNNKMDGKTTPGYGMNGNNVHYSLDIYPDVKMSRTTIRSLIEKDPKLVRALNITAELLQLHQYHRAYLVKEDLLCTPEELYKDIKAKGYDWNELLETRGHWLHNQYTAETKFLSTIDLLRMRKDLYTPYWKEKKKDK